MPSSPLSVTAVVCTHNPRPDHLGPTLDSLRAQTLPTNRWEFLLVDNASAEPLAGRTDLGWHPNGRVVREDRTGLTWARLRSFHEARAILDVLQASPETRRQWGAEARERVQRRYAFDRVGPEQEAAYREILATTAGPRP